MSFPVDLPTFKAIVPDSPTGAPCVLVCEDEGLTALRLKRMLTLNGYAVVGEAGDGEEAVRLAEKLRPDIVLMDVNMPKMDGIQATQRITSAHPTAVIMLTAYSEPELVQRALDAGASGYLVKPVAVEQLQTALTVARARHAELRQEREIAHLLARSLVGEIPPIAGFTVTSRYEPAFEAARVGGDFYDAFDLDEQRVGIVIGDVCGKGLAAAGHTARARHMLHAYSVEDPAPARVISRLNHALCQQSEPDSLFVTVVYGVLDRQSHTFTYASAGHPPPVLYDPAERRCHELRSTGGMVGAVPDMLFTEESVPLSAGAVLALFTDGVTEAHVATSMLGGAGVRAVVQEHATESVDVIADAILERASEFAGGYLRDDVAVVVLKSETIHGRE